MTEERKEPAGPSRRALLILLVVSVLLMVIGVVRCSFELTSEDGALEGAAEVSESR